MCLDSLQIIVHGTSGFHIDPYHGEQAAEIMADFFEAASKDTAAWDEMSEASLQRIKEKYTWALYADRLMTLTRVYRCTGFSSPHADILCRLARCQDICARKDG